mgnify:CR=1 FL=1
MFRGEAVNRPEPDEYARRADVRRLLAAYDHAAQALDALFINRFLPLFTDAGQPGYAPTYVSHEALLLEYESALVRCGEHGQPYASSAHLLWIGERTRQPDGAHVAFAASITNPVAVKIGPTATVDEVAALIDRLGGPPGRLTLIVRMGARAVTERLPALLDGLGSRARQVVWFTDPMHGNTVRLPSGQKTRVLTDIVAEVRGFFAALTARGLPPGGLHLELTPDPVTECVADARALARPDPLPRYLSTCDPRLDHEQALTVVATAADLLVKGAA